MEDVLVGFRFHMDITKSHQAIVNGKRRRLVEGMASVETPDQQGETVIQKGMNFRPFLATGHLNYDHQSVRRGSPAYIIGEPLDAHIGTDPLTGCDAFFVKGWLYDDPDNKPVADEVWKHIQALSKAKSDRHLGFSIEGTTNLKIGRRIQKSTIYHLAITPAPVHDASYCNFQSVMKSLAYATTLDEDILAGQDWDVARLIKAADTGGLDAMTTGSTTALHKEDLEHGKIGKKSRLKEAVASIWGDRAMCKSDCYDGDGHFTKGIDGYRDHLVKCMGWDRDEATALTATLKGAW